MVNLIVHNTFNKNPSKIFIHRQSTGIVIARDISMHAKLLFLFSFFVGYVVCVDALLELKHSKITGCEGESNWRDKEKL